MISQHLTDKTINCLKKAAFWASMVDETTDIATLQQYITFVLYVEEGEIKVSFWTFVALMQTVPQRITCTNIGRMLRLSTGLIRKNTLRCQSTAAPQCSAKTTHLHNESSLTTRVCCQCITMHIVLHSAVPILARIWRLSRLVNADFCRSGVFLLYLHSSHNNSLSTNKGTRQVVNVLLRHAERGGCRMTRPLI